MLLRLPNGIQLNITQWSKNYGFPIIITLPDQGKLLLQNDPEIKSDSLIDILLEESGRRIASAKLVNIQYDSGFIKSFNLRVATMVCCGEYFTLGSGEK